VGQNLGAGKPERVKHGFRSALAASAVLSVITAVVMVTFRRQLISIFSTDPEVIRIGSEYLVIVSVFYPVFSSMFITGGVLRGAGDTLIQMFFSLLALWIIRIPISALLSGVLGTQGIWWGIPAGWIVGLTANSLYYRSGRWKTKVVTGRTVGPR
jgi:Na+-driven multidrug efflux pump